MLAFGGISGLKLVRICLYFVQSALWNCSRGLIGIGIGLVETVAMMGVWSEGVRGPGSRARLRLNFLLVRTISGLPVPLWFTIV